MLRLDFGCGPAPKDGFAGVDLVPAPGVVYEMDIESDDWPWEESSVDGAFSSHFVEHCRDLVGFMRRLHHVMKPGARVEIQHPYQFNVRAWQDPTHVRCLNEVSWFYFDKKWRGGTDNSWGGYGATDFDLIDLTAIPMPDWQKVSEDHPEEFEKAARNLVNVIADIHVVLECRK